MEKLSPKHFKEIIDIIKLNWNYQDYNRSLKNSRLFSALDFYDCLTRSNYSDFIMQDDKVVGFLLGKVKNQNLLDYSIYKIVVKVLEKQLDQSLEGQIFLDYGKLYEKVDKGLYKSTRIKGEAEVILFALHPDYKRQGIGTKLLFNWLNFLENNSIKNCYLFSDSTCDFQFYLNNNFKQLKGVQERAELRHGEKIDFYIFEKKL